jgi:hypothetical protein
LLAGDGVDVGARGGVIEGAPSVAISGLRRLRQQHLVVDQRRCVVAAAKRREYFAQPRGGGPEFAAAVFCKRVQRGAARCASGSRLVPNTRRRGETRREALDMQFADEELRHASR